MSVDPTSAVPSHQISLEESDGSNKYGLVLCNSQGDADIRGITKTPIRRMPLRMVQGDTEWSDFELPYQNVAQDDWSGGLGLKDSEDKTRFWHGQNINTMHANKLFIGPQPHITSGYRVQEERLYDSPMVAEELSNIMFAVQIIPDANITPTRVEIIIRKLGTPNGNLNVELWTDDGSDKPNAIIAGASGTLSNAETSWAETYAVSLGTPPTLTAGTKYFLVVYGDASDDADNCWEIYWGGQGTPIARESNSISSPSWITGGNFYLKYRLTEAQDDMVAMFFEYKGALYAVTREDDGGTPKLYINGTRGRSVDASSSTTLEHTGASWTVNEWQYDVVVIVGGTGIGQWRQIASNDADTLTVLPAWETTPVTANTEYVILGSDAWTEIGSTGLTGPVTNVLVVKDVAYFCQGEAVNIRRFNYAANANSFADDSTNKATFMELVHESDGAQVFKANNAATSVTVARAPVQAWGTDLVFATAIDCGNSDVLITGLERYFDPEYLLVLKQNQVGRIVGDEYQVMPLREMVAAKSDNTGHASTVGGVYLYFSLLRGLERYYQGRLDDIGPNRDDGLPDGFQGPITYAFSFPGRIYIAVSGEDQTTSSYSSILVQNGLGWHPLYRSRLPGEKIRYMHHQVIPGAKLDRLWISEGSDMVWLSMPSETLDPTQDSLYECHYFGVYESSWYYLKLRDVPKTFNDIVIWAEGITGNIFIGVEYKIDEDTSWTSIGETWSFTPSESFSISSSSSQKQGKRIKFRLILFSNGGSNIPVVTAHVLEAVAHLPTKFRYSVQFKIDDESIDLRDEEEFIAVSTLSSQLETWANSGTQLIMRHHATGPMNTKTVFISAPTYTPLSNKDDEDKASFLCTMEIFEA